MNRKQKVAVVVGAVLFAAAICFPPRQYRSFGFDAPDHATGPTRLMWIGAPVEVYAAPPGFEGTPGPEVAEILATLGGPANTYQVPTGRWMMRGGLLMLIVNALVALTVAAVVVLKERRP